MANPNNAIGTNGAFGGRTSVNAFNDVLSAFSGRGVISGWGCTPSSGLTVTLGGDGTNRDVAIAEDASGNKTTVDNISQSPISVTVNAAPASNSRVDAIVAYIEDSPNGSGITDNPDVVNIVVVSGTVASIPSRPTDSAIRAAITADGASGSTAYYVVLAYVTIPTGTTDIDATMIAVGDKVELDTALAGGIVGTNNISNGAVTSDKVDFTTLLFTKETINFTWRYNVGTPVTVQGFRLHLGGNVYLIGANAITSLGVSSGGTKDMYLTMPSGTIKVLGYAFNASWNGHGDSATHYVRFDSDTELTCYLYAPAASDGSAVNFLGTVEMSS